HPVRNHHHGDAVELQGRTWTKRQCVVGVAPTPATHIPVVEVANGRRCGKWLRELIATASIEPRSEVSAFAVPVRLFRQWRVMDDPDQRVAHTGPMESLQDPHR